MELHDTKEKPRATAAGFLSPEAAAAYLNQLMPGSGIDERRLREWRKNDTGPIYYKPIKAIWYRAADLDEWLFVDSARTPGDEPVRDGSRRLEPVCGSNKSKLRDTLKP